MADFQSEYDPTFDFEMPAVGYEIMAFTALAALAGVGIGALFTLTALETGTATATVYTVTYETGGQVLVYTSGTALTEGQAAIVAVIESGGLASEPIAVGQILASWGFELQTLDGLLALAAYDVNAQNPGYGSGFLDPGSVPGGLGVPPGFPGSGLPGGPPGSYWGCVIVNGEPECTLYF